MHKRPVRVTISMSADEYDRLAWAAFYLGEGPSTLAYRSTFAELDRVIADTEGMAKAYEDYRRSKTQVVPGRSKRKGSDHG